MPFIPDKVTSNFIPDKKKSTQGFVPDKPTSNFVSDADEFGAITTMPSWGSRFLAHRKRQGALIAKGLTPDILEQYLPEKIKEITPFLPGETGTSVISELTGDIGRIMAIEAVGRKLGAIPTLAGVGTKLASGGRIAKFAGRYAPEFLKGAAFGATEAKEFKDIPKQAAATGAFFAGIPMALRGAPVAGKFLFKRLPKPVQKRITDVASKIGHSVGTSIKQNIKGFELVRRRYQDMWNEKIKSSLFIRDLKRKITPQEDELLPFFREKAFPKGVQVSAASKAKLEPISKEVGNYLDDTWDFLAENYGDDIGFVENYIPHIWDIPKNKIKDVAKWFVTKSPFLKQRRVATIKEGIEKFGLKPKYTKMTDILKVYDDYRIKAAANLKFVKEIKDLKDVAGIPLVQRADKAPADWVPIRHPAFGKGVYRGVVKEGEIPIIQKVGVKVHPEIADSVKTVLGQGWDREVTSDFLANIMRATSKINAFGKFSNLSLSLFHHVALTEAAISTGIGGRALKVAAKPFLHPIQTWKAIKSGNYGAFRNLPLTKDAVSNGLQIGAISDVRRNIIEQSLVGMENKLKQGNIIAKAMGKTVTPVRKAVEFWNKSLWDYYHTELKLMSYEKLVSDGLKKYPQMPEQAVKREVAQFVNDTFGGQAWDLLLKSPKWQQSMHWLLLSPDWTLSTIRQALSPTGAGAVSALTKELRKDMGVDFWKRAIVYFWGGMNIANYTATKATYGKGRYMWDNPPGSKTKLFVGHNPDGTESYLRFGKQFREVPEYFIDPINKFKGKAAPLLRSVFAQVFPHQYYQKEIATTKGLKNIKARLKEVAKFPTPYSIQNIARTGITPTMPLKFAFPISRGLTPYKTRELYKNAILNNDIQEIQKISQHALRNNLNPVELYKQTESSIKSDKTFDRKKTLLPIIQQLFSMPINQRADYIKSLKDDKTLKEEDIKIMGRLIEKQLTINEMKKMFKLP